MDEQPILIIGAGASGLMAARELLKAGRKVIVLEANDRAGGRIHTVHDPSFFSHLELGAEFIHGRLPVTLSLLKEGNISYCPVQGTFWQINREGKPTVTENHLQLLTKELDQLTADQTADDFLRAYFSGEQYSALRDTVRGFIRGYDTADTSRASILAFREEWLDEEEEQYRVSGGYMKLIDFLLSECKSKGAFIYFSKIIKKIGWQKGKVTALTSSGEQFSGSRIIITVPLGILLSSGQEKSSIIFSPAIDGKLQAAKEIGYGSVVKIFLQFDHSLWNDLPEFNQVKNGHPFIPGFIFSEATIPTWWTQFSDNPTLLTGWLGGTPAKQYENEGEVFFLKAAIDSLSAILKVTPGWLKEKLISSKIAHWTRDPFTLGSYSYETIASGMARAILNMSVENTIFFAGEAFYTGKHKGTVEAALGSGLAVAKRITGYKDQTE